MIKVITIIMNFIVVTLVALLFGSCNQIGNINSITGSGHVTTEKREVSGDFKSVSVSSAIDLVVEQSDKTEIIVEADDNLQKEIITKVENGVLVITCKKGNFINVSSKKVTVKMPVIEGLEASSASTINSATTLKGTNLSLASSSAASIHATVEYETVELDGSSASNQNIKGKALQIEATTSSASVIDATDLLANEVVASSSSGGSITVHPIVKLKAEASSGGNVAYNGSPKTVQKEESSGGSIHQN
ncbi:head GIN domain-containing protein [Flavobacterium aquiphilum]|uniref:head GIN domain-containing protein n=1 Tax=Flavobacterium aquiphilum TaxID=3003261 RepID=UPI002480063C|nr:head GIN domain-containing protein [Flavobacterium aquiphilum]